jgi:uncharacterized damage-inducible protein DinB
MSPELERIEEQLRRCFEADAWHGPSVLEALAGLSPEEAHAHPVPGAHSIWELTLHLAGTYGLVLRRLDGDARPLAPEEDWPAVPAPTAERWVAAISELRDLNREMRRRVLAFSPARLDDPIVAPVPYTAYTQLIGLTQHDLYHAGQMAILKHALRAAKGRRSTPAAARPSARSGRSSRSGRSRRPRRRRARRP